MNRDELRTAILADDDRPREPVDVPWNTNGTKLYARALSIGAWGKWLTADVQTLGPKVMAEIVCESLVDEDGQRIFHDRDAKALLEKNAIVVKDICEMVMRLSGLDVDEEREEDFGTAQPGQPSTG
jgi:hypothetical protein